MAPPLSSRRGSASIYERLAVARGVHGGGGHGGGGHRLHLSQEGVQPPAGMYRSGSATGPRVVSAHWY
jgi:hypothetical protein